MRSLAVCMFAILAAISLAQVEFVHSPCGKPAGSTVSMQPSVAFDLTSSGMDSIAHAVLAFLQKQSSQTGSVLVPFLSGEYKMPIGGNILYNLTDVRLTHISIDSVSNSLDVPNQITNLLYSGINATIVLEYSFVQNNFLKMPRGSGIATIVASQGVVSVGVGNAPEGKLYVASSNANFQAFDIKLTTSFSFLINLLLSVFKGPLTTVINKQFSTMFAKTLGDGLAGIDTMVPHSMTLLKGPYAMTVSLGYATPQVATSSVRQYLEIEFTPAGRPATVVDSCLCPIVRVPVPTLTEIAGQDFDVVAAFPEATINTLFWTLHQNQMLNFMIPSDKEIVISTLFPDHPVDLHVEPVSPPVTYFNQTDVTAAYASLFLKYTAVEKTGKVFATFTAVNDVKFHVGIRSSEFDPKIGFHNAAVSVQMETVNVHISNLQFFGVVVPDWTVASLTTKLETMTSRAVQEVVEFAAGDGIGLPFPPFIGIESGKLEFSNGLSYLKLKIDVLQA